MLIQALAHLGNGGKVERIVGSLPRHDLHRDWQAQQIQGREHHFQLGQVGTVGFAVAQLEQPLFRDRPVPARGGPIDPS